MPASKFTKSELKIIEKNLVKEYKRIRDEYNIIPSTWYLSQKFNISCDTVRRILKEHNLERRKEFDRRSTRYLIMEKVREELKNMITPFYDNVTPYPKIPVDFPSKVLIVDDEHFPFCQLELFEEILEREDDSEVLVLSELLDVQTFSNWPKRYFENLSLIEKKVKDIMDFLAKKFDKIVVIMGNNHHLRIIKFLESLPVDQMEYLRGFFKVYPQFLKDYPNVIPVKSSFIQIGKAVICHFDSYSSVPVKTAKESYDFLRKHFDVFGIDLPDSVWVGHTHCLRMDFSSERVLLAEIGCLSYLQPYLFDRGKISYTKKNRWTLGYGVLYLNPDGSTDYENSRVKFLGYSDIPFSLKKMGG